jgi:hypothetical protein
MKINVNHPSFINFLDTISNSILSNISAENYFLLPQESKMAVLYMVFKLMKSSIKMRASLGDNEMKAFIGVLWKKNEEAENYEFAAILKDIMNNFDAVNEFTKINKRTARVVRVDKTNNV